MEIAKRTQCKLLINENNGRKMSTGRGFCDRNCHFACGSAVGNAIVHVANEKEARAKLSLGLDRN